MPGVASAGHAIAHSVLPLEQIRASDTATAGGKGANLGEMVAQGFPVPPGYVVPAPACRAFFHHLNLSNHIRGLDGTTGPELVDRCQALERRIVETATPEPLAAAILAAHARLAQGRDGAMTWVVRSSATAEDLAGASFAGQHGTYYYVTEAQLLEMIRHCWASLWTPEAVTYRTTHGIPHGSVFMAVVVQEMIRSEIAGVAFTVNPVTGDRGELVIESSWGMGAAIVDGRVTPDRYILARPGLEIREGRIAEKRFMVPTEVPARRSQRIVAVAHELQRRETLTPDQVRRVAEWSLKCEQHFGTPQDVEWAMVGDRIYLLQSRPVTTLAREDAFRAPAGKYLLFKALAENFTDPMTPLSMDLLTAVPPPGLRFIGGRLYQDLRVARRLIPFELSDEDLVNLAYLSSAAPRSPLRISWRRLPVVLGLGLAAYLVFAVILARSRYLPDEFMGSYRALCRRMVTDPKRDPLGALFRLFLLPSPLDPIGDMPLLINVMSFRSIVWMAALRAMVRRWMPRAPDDAVPLLCSGTEGVLSAEMGRDIWRLASEARQTAPVRDILLRSNPEQALLQLQREPGAVAFVHHLDRFLAVHGHRALKEFEMQSVRWEENPAPVLGMIRNYLQSATDPGVHEEKAAQARAEFEAEVRQTVGGGIRWRLIRFAAGRARYYLKQRENSRFYHIMGFGAVRQKILAVEAELLGQSRLKCKDDIFFLHWDEVQHLRSGQLGWTDVEGRIRGRRLEHVRLSKISPPKTIGIDLPSREHAEPAADTLVGQSASPGRFTGRARVILDPSVDLSLQPGEVLVAPYTDPAWTPLFLTAGAAVIEVGSYLSHAGTVAREFGMPCVVDASGCTRRIQTGMRVDVDGDRGMVRILEAGQRQ